MDPHCRGITLLEQLSVRTQTSRLERRTTAASQAYLFLRTILDQPLGFGPHGFLQLPPPPLHSVKFAPPTRRRGRPSPPPFSPFFGRCVSGTASGRRASSAVARRRDRRRSQARRCMRYRLSCGPCTRRHRRRCRRCRTPCGVGALALVLCASIPVRSRPNGEGLCSPREMHFFFVSVHLAQCLELQHVSFLVPTNRHILPAMPWLYLATLAFTVTGWATVTPAQMFTPVRRGLVHTKRSCLCRQRLTSHIPAWRTPLSNPPHLPLFLITPCGASSPYSLLSHIPREQPRCGLTPPLLVPGRPGATPSAPLAAPTTTPHVTPPALLPPSSSAILGSPPPPPPPSSSSSPPWVSPSSVSVPQSSLAVVSGTGCAASPPSPGRPPFVSGQRVVSPSEARSARKAPSLPLPPNPILAMPTPPPGVRTDFTTLGVALVGPQTSTWVSTVVSWLYGAEGAAKSVVVASGRSQISVNRAKSSLRSSLRVFETMRKYTQLPQRVVHTLSSRT